MTRKTIIEKLKQYLDGVTISRLEIVTDAKIGRKDLGICFIISDIFRENEFNEEDEKAVDELLIKLVSILF